MPFEFLEGTLLRSINDRCRHLKKHIKKLEKQQSGMCVYNLYVLTLICTYFHTRYLKKMYRGKPKSFNGLKAIMSSFKCIIK